MYSHLPRKFKIFPSFIQCRYNYCCSFFIKSCRLSTISILFIGLKLGQKMMFMHFTLSFFRTISDSFFACGLFSQGSQIKKTTCVAYPFLFSELCNFFRYCVNIHSSTLTEKSYCLRNEKQFYKWNCVVKNIYT